MTKRTIRMQETTRHENESLVMVEREQEDLQQHDHLFFELVYITGGTCEHTLNDTKTILHGGDYFLWILAARTAMKTAAG